MHKDMPQCYFGLSGSYSLGSRILFYSCIAGSILSLICRGFWKPGQRHRLDSIITFSVSTTLMMASVAALHIIVICFLSITTAHYRYVTDLDLIVADYFVRLGYAAALIILYLWPYEYSFGQSMMFQGIHALFIASAASQAINDFTSSGVAAECLGSGLQACLAACSTNTAPLRAGSNPFPYAFPHTQLGHPRANLVSGISQVISLGSALVSFFASAWFSESPSLKRYYPARTGLNIVASASLLLSLVTGEIHLQHPPFSIGQEPLSSVGQWGAMASAAMIVIWSITFLSLADVSGKQSTYSTRVNYHPWCEPFAKPEPTSTEIETSGQSTQHESTAKAGLRQRFPPAPSEPLLTERSNSIEAEVTHQIPTGLSTGDTPAVDRT
ncbi:hypothetical protein A4X09_0g3533 [Tilletia walkeri]|uniref:Uncharacterized protein n=1 Tax=Tilletia walkeri TaxID=117179 RepID=A0A8X7T547_9BASI|nr:hypothetical protein A4X09_0g3533 [Tilletia walkeri]